ncbi:MAG TPA: pilus assembly protein PilM [Candidatus Paceibacterota bacterium]|nr:pilus assembly protein PilM [Candidatus Paceibacterota bacterium]
MRPPVRRVLALDAGSRCIKLLLAESDFGRLRVLKEELIDLQAEGLVAPDEIKAHLQASLEEWGRPPLALILPQHVSISQVIDLPLAPESEVEKMIHDETVKLGGVSESRIVYDFVRTETAAKNRQQFWVTLSQEGDVRERILRLGVEQEDLCEVTTTANALIAAYRAASPLSSRAILVHLGAQTTVVAVVVAGQGVFATSFQMGGDFFTRSLSRLRNCSEESAESVKRTDNLLIGPEACPAFASVVDGWVAELKRQLNEWFDHNPILAPEAASFQLVASGGAFDQPGLIDYLKEQAGLNLQPWPQGAQPEAVLPSKRFEVAYGAALQALGYSTQPVSLLPDDYRIAWRKRLIRQRLELTSLGLAVLCLLVLAFGTWHQISLFSRKQALLTKVLAAQEAVEANDALAAELCLEYESFRPVFASQQNTLDTLKTFALLQESRSNRSFWYMLLADQQSYFNQPPGPYATNKLSRTNVFGPVTSRARGAAAEFSAVSAASTNLSPAKPGYIAELCIPEDADGARRVRRELVDELKRQPLFSKVDLLSDDLRRNLADPKVIVPERDFVLALDFATVEFQQPLPPRKPLPGLAPRTATRSGPRPLWMPSGSAENSTPVKP